MQPKDAREPIDLPPSIMRRIEQNDKELARVGKHIILAENSFKRERARRERAEHRIYLRNLAVYAERAKTARVVKQRDFLAAALKRVDEHVRHNHPREAVLVIGAALESYQLIGLPRSRKGGARGKAAAKEMAR